VNTNFADLDTNVCCGCQPIPHDVEGAVEHAAETETETDTDTEANTDKEKLRGFYRNYNSSHTGHGTVMAYYIRRLCPHAELLVIKLQPVTTHTSMEKTQISFSMDSATKVSYMSNFQHIQFYLRIFILIVQRQTRP
jgi:hypothetical protein